jgi:hypothetical protein
MFVTLIFAAGGLLFAFEHATIAGKLVLLLLSAHSGKIDNHCGCSKKTRASPARRFLMFIGRVARR